jgi:hypothetical protein
MALRHDSGAATAICHQDATLLDVLTHAAIGTLRTAMTVELPAELSAGVVRRDAG